MLVRERRPSGLDRELVVVVSDGPGEHGVLVNGRPAPLRAHLPGFARIRLRIINLCLGRIIQAGVTGIPHPLLVALDGQPCGAFEPRQHTIPLPPGASADLVCDLPDDPAQTGLVLRGASDQPLLTILRTTHEPRAHASPAATPRPAFAGLASNPALPETIALERAKRADLVINAGTGTVEPSLLVEGRGTTATPFLSVKKGTPVSIGLVNRTDQNQPITLCGQVVRQLHAFDDGWEPCWRNHVVVPASKTLRLAFVPMVAGRWRIESGNAALAARGLWHWIEVV
jgi:hypothetical protein